MAKKTPPVVKKVETVAEFLARGGKVTVCPPGETVIKDKQNVKSMVVGPANIMTYEDADHYYGEKKTRKSTKEPKKVNINLGSLPADFLKKLGV